MEQTEGHRSVEAKIRDFEEQLAPCDLAINECEQSGREAEQKIEDHFSQCLTMLAARKAYLLREVAQKVNNQRQKIEAARATLVSSIDACRNTMRSATLVYSVDPVAAGGLFQALLRIATPTIARLKITTKLQDTFLTAIQSHGEVGDTSSFSRADIVTTFAGSVQGNEDGHGQNAKLSYPWGICFNTNDSCLYFVCNGNNAIKKLTLQGHVSTFASGQPFKNPMDITTYDKERTIYVVNLGAHIICKITSAGTVSIFAGSGKKGSADGTGMLASFNSPVGIAVDQKTGNIFVGDQGNHSIRKISPQGVVTTLAGSTQGCVDGNGVSAKFTKPYGVCFDENNRSLLVCDNGNNKLRLVSANGDVVTLCDIPSPRSVTVTQNSAILVTSGNHRIYKVTLSQGNYTAEVTAVDGNAEECSMNYPTGIVVHEESHSCFVVDHGSHTIRKVSFVTPT